MKTQSKTRHFASVIAVLALLCAANPGSAETSWSPIILPTGQYRATIKSMPIEARPNRPLHFYGNTVRRRYYRNNPLPTARDIFTTSSMLRQRRFTR